MKDILYDIKKRDVVMTANNDFATTDNPSVQNGGLLLLARANNIKNLIMGIGINQIRGGTVAQAAYEMSRWKQQVKEDGGRGTVNTTSDGEGNVSFTWGVNYL